VSAKKSVSTDPPSPPAPPPPSLTANHTTTNLAKGGARESKRDDILFSFSLFLSFFLLLPLLERKEGIISFINIFDNQMSKRRSESQLTKDQFDKMNSNGFNFSANRVGNGAGGGPDDVADPSMMADRATLSQRK